jgi:hypothetical protein
LSAQRSWAFESWGSPAGIFLPDALYLLALARLRFAGFQGLTRLSGILKTG